MRVSVKKHCWHLEVNLHSSLLPELQTGLGDGKALYHKKEYDAAIHTIEEVLGSSNNKRLLSEVCR